MKYRLFLFFILLSLEYTKVFSQTDWVLDNSSESRIYTSDIDSITYTNENGEFSHNLWLGGRIVEKREIKEGDVFEPKEVSLKYDYCTFEEDGMEGILTDNGGYALFMATPDSAGYVYTFGQIGDDQTNCILYDSLGYIRSIVSEGEEYQVLYSTESLWIVDRSGNLKTEIPYTELAEDDTNSHNASSREFLQNTSSYAVLQDLQNTSSYAVLQDIPLYPLINNSNTLFGYLGNWRQSLGLDLLHTLLRGVGNRYGDVAGYLIRAALTGNLLDYFNALDGEVEMFFFANASVTALDAIEEDICSYTIPCRVEELYENTCAVKFYRNYCDVMGIDFILDMSVNKSNLPHNEPQFESKKIDGSGTYSFSFDFRELEESYNYEPSLTMDITLYGYDILTSINNMLNPMYLFHFFSHPNGNIYHRICKINGRGNFLVTGSVSCTIEKVENVKSRTADVICSFSSVPKGAECIVSVSQNESEISFLYHGEPGKESQTVSVDNLSMNTSYVASCYIKHHGRTYPGIKSVEFQTTSPSGKVISIDPETITTSSATVKCEFNGIESDVECGIVVQSSEQTLTFSASSKGGEQLITLSGLKPGTQYRCYAFVKSSNYYRRQRTSVSFTTNVPGIVGTWNCVEEYDWRPYPSAAWQTKTRSYTLTLHSDGSITVNGLDYNYIGGSWDYSSSGLFTATGHVFATQTQNSWDRFEGTVDSVKNPKRITGVRYRGNMNMVVNVEDVAGRITMTR